MTTALDIITDALQEIGVVDAGGTVEPEDASFCLRKLNVLIQRLSNTRLALPVLTQISVTVTGAETYTIGPSGGVVAARPLKVVSAIVRDSGGNDSPVDILNAVQWGAIYKKDIDAPPTDVWYEGTATNGTLHVYPQSAGYTLILDCMTLLTSFASTASTLTLPEGYESMLALSLVDEIAGPYRQPVTPDQRRRLMGAMSAVKRTNTEPLYVGIEAALVGDTYQIERGY
jgi:hypothetical protein